MPFDLVAAPDGPCTNNQLEIGSPEANEIVKETKTTKHNSNATVTFHSPVIGKTIFGLENQKSSHESSAEVRLSKRLSVTSG
jgi:hypothetical protein